MTNAVRMRLLYYWLTP